MLICIGLIVTALALLLPWTAYADIGPKPTLTLIFYDVRTEPKVEIEDVTLYSCGPNADCSLKQPLQELGPQRLICDAEGCSTALYESGAYWQLEIRFSDTILLSEPFEKVGFYSTYRVSIDADELSVILESAKEGSGSDQLDPLRPNQGGENTLLRDSIGPILVALALTILIELAVGGLLFRLAGIPPRYLLWVLVGNMITVPLVWAISPELELSGPGLTLTQWILAVVLETITLTLGSRTGVRWAQSFLFVGLLNLVSSLLGVLLVQGEPWMSMLAG